MTESATPPSFDEGRAAELDEIAYRAWPAERVELVSPWRIRVTRGVTRRANSVMPRLAYGPMPQEQQQNASEWAARVETVERLYRAEGLAPRFQIAPGAQPRDLDARLASLGYEIEAPVSIQCASLDVVTGAIRNALDGDVSASCGAMGDAWFEEAGKRGRFRDHLDVFAGILARLGDAAGFARAEIDGETVATALAVHDGEWVGIFAMRTVERFRRRGAGRALLAAITRFASHRGATRAYLQVEQDNAGAFALYRKAGFTTAYGYHYRRLV